MKKLISSIATVVVLLACQAAHGQQINVDRIVEVNLQGHLSSGNPNAAWFYYMRNGVRTSAIVNYKDSPQLWNMIFTAFIIGGPISYDQNAQGEVTQVYLRTLN